MHEEEIADYLDLMLESVKLVEARFLSIQTPEDFVKSEEGVTLLDSISMRLQVIGESVIKIQKLNTLFLLTYSDVEWDKIARFRDFVSHHYAQIDHEIIFDICQVHVQKLKDNLKKMISDLSTTKQK